MSRFEIHAPRRRRIYPELKQGERSGIDDREDEEVRAVRQQTAQGTGIMTLLVNRTAGIAVRHLDFPSGASGGGGSVPDSEAMSSVSVSPTSSDGPIGTSPSLRRSTRFTARLTRVSTSAV